MLFCRVALPHNENDLSDNRYQPRRSTLAVSKNAIASKDIGR